MKNLLPFFLLLLAPRHAAGFETSAASASFDEAAKAASYLKFEIPVRKFLFGAHETGYARKFEAHGKIEGTHLSEVKVEFDAHDLDTDLYARNDQMWNYCLGYKENPRIQVAIPAVDFTEGKPVTSNGTMRIRGKEKALPVEISLTRKNGKWVADGSAHATFASLEIPDPSIGVAAVKGPIDITFHLEDK